MTKPEVPIPAIAGLGLPLDRLTALNAEKYGDAAVDAHPRSAETLGALRPKRHPRLERLCRAFEKSLWFS